MAEFNDAGKSKVILICLILGAVFWIVQAAVWLGGSDDSGGNSAAFYIGAIFAIGGAVAFLIAFGFWLAEKMGGGCGGEPLILIESICLFVGAFLFLVAYVILISTNHGFGWGGAPWGLCMGGSALWMVGFLLAFIQHMIAGSFCSPWQTTTAILCYVVGSILLLVFFAAGGHLDGIFFCYFAFCALVLFAAILQWMS